MMMLNISFILFFVLSYSFNTNGYVLRAGSLKSLKPSTASSPVRSDFSLRSGEKKVKISIVEPLGKGIKEDIQRKAPFYLSDFKDGFNTKTVSSAFFLFFACLSPAVAFGSLLAIATGGIMGTVETVGATAIGGVIYALFSGQPLTIIGTTGPLLAFLKVLYTACMNYGLPFLPVYAWIGIWSSFFLLLASLFSISNLVNYFTRFTDDIFSTLISVIFIYEALMELLTSYTNPLIPGMQATVTTLVALSTLFISMLFKSLRNSAFFPRKMRNTLSDFAPTIGTLSGIAAATLISKRYGLSLPMLAVPQVLGTTTGRPWLVDIFSVSNEVKLLCFFPALMATILLFMDQNITVHLVNSKQNKLKKGYGLHLDMLVVSIVTLMSSLLGLPWMIAATVRSIAHISSLKEYTIVEKTIPELPVEGEEEGAKKVKKLQMSGVMEQRVTGFTIHALIGAAVLYCRPLLRKIPVAALTGMFLYLGVSSVGSTEFFQRIKLFFYDPLDAPRSEWMEKVGRKRTNLFTGIQFLLLSSMWWMKNTKFGVFFPVFIGILSPIRIALEKFNVFKKEELEILDGEIA